MASRRTRWEIAQPIAKGAGHPERTSPSTTDLISTWMEWSIESEKVPNGIRDARKLRRGRAIVTQRP